MIVYPENWLGIGQPVDCRVIPEILCLALSEINCRNLSLSGGLDSTYMLYCMTRVFDHSSIHAYTVTGSENHPDYIHAKIAADHFGVEWHPWILPPGGHSQDPTGGLVIRAFYENLVTVGVPGIIACDGIDEYMCGYYAHQDDPTAKCYYNFLGALLEEHLKPLNEDSGGVSVYLPYLDERLIAIYNRIPIDDKISSSLRKKVMVSLATGHIPDSIIQRRKYGFCSAGNIS